MDNCKLSFDKSELERADLVLFQGTTFKAPSLEKPDGQVDIYPELFCIQPNFINLNPSLCTPMESYGIDFLYIGLVVVQPGEPL